METKKIHSLKERIIAEMTVDYSNALEKNFDLARQFIRITREGKIEVLNKEKLNGIEQILLYLIGKLYAKEAGFATTDDASNKELMDELGIPKGSLLPWQKSLREQNKIKQVKKGKLVNHAIASNMVEKILKDVEKKLQKHG